jgi:hypothetical protein
MRGSGFVTAPYSTGSILCGLAGLRVHHGLLPGRRDELGEPL